jgi:transposase
MLNAILHVAEHGCKWRGLPKHFGRWHTIYTRMNRWAKAGVLDRVFERLQQERIIHIKIEAVSLDSTSIKVHPDGTGALKNRPTVQSTRSWIEPTKATKHGNWRSIWATFPLFRPRETASTHGLTIGSCIGAATRSSACLVDSKDFADSSHGSINLT